MKIKNLEVYGHLYYGEISAKPLKHWRKISFKYLRKEIGKQDPPSCLLPTGLFTIANANSMMKLWRRNSTSAAVTFKTQRLERTLWPHKGCWLQKRISTCTESETSPCVIPVAFQRTWFFKEWLFEKNLLVAVLDFGMHLFTSFSRYSSARASLFILSKTPEWTLLFSCMPQVFVYLYGTFIPAPKNPLFKEMSKDMCSSDLCKDEATVATVQEGRWSREKRVRHCNTRVRCK